MIQRGAAMALLAQLLAGPAIAQGLAAPAPAASAPAAPTPASPLDSYADAATTTIIAEQSCPGVQMKAGQLTNLRLAARVNTGQEPALQEKLRRCAGEMAALRPRALGRPHMW